MSTALVVLYVITAIYPVGIILCVVVGAIIRVLAHAYSDRVLGARLIVHSAVWPLWLARIVKEAWLDLLDDAKERR